MILAQVLEPFEVLETIKDAVETAGAALGSPAEPQPPIDRAQAGLTSQGTDTVGRYFSRVDISNGVITVRYGNDAHPLIDSRTLTLTPYESADGTIVWRCGNAPYPPGTQLMGTSAGVVVAAYAAPTLINSHLPYDCRP